MSTSTISEVFRALWKHDTAKRIAATFFRKNGLKMITDNKKKILQGVMSGPGGQGTGTRLWPPPDSTLNSELGLRLDWGGPVVVKDGKQFQSINLQVNRQATAPALKEVAKVNTHEKRCSFEYECDDQGRPNAEEGEWWDAFDDMVLKPVGKHGL